MRQIIAALALGVFLGNLMGDKQTAIDCATNGHAKLFGGGYIQCYLVKEE